jgi:hypothetical protein
LRTAFEGSDGVQAYSMSVAHDPEVLELLGATEHGSDARHFFADNFTRTELAREGTGVGFVSYVILSFMPGQSLPATGDFSLVRALYRILDPEAPPTRGSAGPIVVDSRIELRDGLRGSGQPVNNRATYQGNTVDPCREPLDLEIAFSGSTPFFRGDANYDHAFDVSDPVTILRAQFYGDARNRCDDAADANDNGRHEVSHAAYAFHYLFGGGPPPHAGDPDDPSTKGNDGNEEV